MAMLPERILGLGGSGSTGQSLGCSPFPWGGRQGSLGEDVCFPCPALQVTLEMRRLETINVLVP